jgi:formate dehydrogenase iron-sulfur subunit
MIDEGKKKVAALRAKGYSNATFYGENELGGLHVLYVLNDTPDKYGLPVDPKFPAATTLWQSILKPMGIAVGGLAIAGLGLNYIAARKAKLDKEKAEKGK